MENSSLHKDFHWGMLLRADSDWVTPGPGTVGAPAGPCSSPAGSKLLIDKPNVAGAVMVCERSLWSNR